MAKVVQVVQEAPVAMEAWEAQGALLRQLPQALLQPLQVEQWLQLHLWAVLLLLQEGLWEAAAWLAVVLVAVADVLLQCFFNSYFLVLSLVITFSV